MPTLLHLDSSPMESSISRELTREFVKTWKAAYPEGAVIYRDVAAHTPKPIDAAWIGAGFTPVNSRTAEQKTVLAPSEELIAELESADEYVFGVAMHNFSIPASLKLWIDQVVRSGRTFSFGQSGAKGLLLGKRATIVVASGAVFEPGTPLASFNFVEPYLKAILGFIGVTEVKFVTAGGTKDVMLGAVDRDTFLKPTLEQVRSVAA
jgi:FMN-dependent NADH-azoreductase